MNPAVMTNDGRELLLGRLVQGDWGSNGDFRWALFTNDYDPTPTSILSQFNRSGIAPAQIAMANGDWQNPTVAEGRSRSYWANAATEFTAIPLTVTAYGLVVWEPSTGVVLWAQLFDAPQTLTAGQTIKVWPYLDYGTCS
jgi:hypothetical protein